MYNVAYRKMYRKTTVFQLGSRTDRQKSPGILLLEVSFLRKVHHLSLAEVHSMVTIETVCQSKVSLMLLLDGLCNGAKTISVQLKEKKIHSRVEDHLNK